MQQSNPPDLRDLQAFAVLADAGSFAAAARRLGRDPTAVSRRIQQLERRLGVRLAERTTRQVKLTEAGRQYLARVRPLLDELDAAGRETAALSDGVPSGRLRLALPGSFARLWLAPLIVSFARAFPKVAIDANYSNSIVDLVAGGYDLAVRLAALPDSRLVARKLASRRRLLVASPAFLAERAAIDHPDALSGQPALCFTGREDCYRWTFDRDGVSRRVPVDCRIASDDADVLVEAAIAGLGLFYTTDWHVGPHLAAGRLQVVLPGWTIPDEGGVYLVTPSASGTPARTRAFVEWIAAGLSPAPWEQNVASSNSAAARPSLFSSDTALRRNASEASSRKQH